MSLTFLAFGLLMAGCPVNPTPQGISATPTEEERMEPEFKYYDPVFAPLAPEVAAAISGGPVDCSMATPFERIGDLLEPGYLSVENGYCLNPDGTGFVAVKTDFPGATAEMIQWWFWWHANEDLRYKIWCPGDHYAISVANVAQASDRSLSYEQRRVGNTHFPYENTGNGVYELAIHFVPSESFGLDPSQFAAAGVEAMVCANVGYTSFGTTFDHTVMCHEFRRHGDGLELRSRFWMGKLLPSSIRPLVITSDVAKGLASHCAHEYSHLSGFLPAIFQEFR